MKKLVVLLAGMLMLAAPALALIDNSAHDLPATFATGVVGDEICVFCHTPHGANSDFTGGPLWNRNASATALVGVYDSATLNASIDQDYTKIDAAACMSCHDGLQSMDALKNPPNTTNAGTYAGTVPAGPKVLGSNMNNDHPVNFDYAAVAAADAEITPIATINALAGQPIKFTTTSLLNNVMQCSTCHDVHNTVGSQLIVINNAGSNLCRACHIK